MFYPDPFDLDMSGDLDAEESALRDDVLSGGYDDSDGEDYGDD